MIEKVEAYLSNNPTISITSGFTSILTGMLGVFTPIIQTLIAIGSLIIILLTIEAKIKERKNEKGKNRH